MSSPGLTGPGKSSSRSSWRSILSTSSRMRASESRSEEGRGVVVTGDGGGGRIGSKVSEGFGKDGVKLETREVKDELFVSFVEVEKSGGQESWTWAGRFKMGPKKAAQMETNMDCLKKTTSQD